MEEGKNEITQRNIEALMMEITVDLWDLLLNLLENAKDRENLVAAFPTLIKLHRAFKKPLFYFDPFPSIVSLFSEANNPEKRKHADGLLRAIKNSLDVVVPPTEIDLGALLNTGEKELVNGSLLLLLEARLDSYFDDRKTEFLSSSMASSTSKKRLLTMCTTALVGGLGTGIGLYRGSDTLGVAVMILSIVIMLVGLYALIPDKSKNLAIRRLAQGFTGLLQNPVRATNNARQITPPTEQQANHLAPLDVNNNNNEIRIEIQQDNPTIQNNNADPLAKDEAAAQRSPRR